MTCSVTDYYGKTKSTPWTPVDVVFFAIQQPGMQLTGDMLACDQIEITLRRSFPSLERKIIQIAANHVLVHADELKCDTNESITKHTTELLHMFAQQSSHRLHDLCAILKAAHPRDTTACWILAIGMVNSNFTQASNSQKKQTQEPKEQPTEEPTEELIEELAEETAEETTEQPMTKPTEAPTEAPTEEPTEEPTDEEKEEQEEHGQEHQELLNKQVQMEVEEECNQDERQQHKDAEDEDCASAVFADADGDIFPHLPQIADLAGMPHMEPASRKHTRHGTSLLDTYVPSY